MPLSVEQHDDGLARCSWCGTAADYIHYHDHEWGWPQGSNERLFEKMTLEGFQSGLSWITVLRKREAFREVFAGFDIEKVARMTDKHVDKLVADARIIRHRGKIESAINNARCISKLLDKHNSVGAFVWRFEPSAKERPARITPEVAKTLTQSEQSVALSKELKKLGFSFVGPTTMYAFMQSMGVVNDHLEGCHARAAVEAARKAFVRPT